MVLNLWLVGLVVIGGLNPETGVVMRKNALQEVFLKVQCLKAWDKIGAVPIMRACLSYKPVHRTLGDADDETNLVIQ